MNFPSYENWNDTTRGLHRGALLLGALQRLTQPPQPAYLELGLEVSPEGLSTGILPAGGRALLDIQGGSLIYAKDGETRASFPLNGRSQAQAFDELFGLLASDELASVLPPGESLFEQVAAGIADRGGRYRAPQRAVLLDEAPIVVEEQATRAYWQALQGVFTAIARFRARLRGMMTPLVVWPEHFDLSTLIFLGSTIDEGQPHVNFGFAPFSEGLEYPYLYAYAYPYPQRFALPELPRGARWHTEGWTGVVLLYEAIAAQPNPQEYLESSCLAIYQGLLRLIAA